MGIMKFEALSGNPLQGGNSLVVAVWATRIDVTGKTIPDETGPVEAFLVAGNTGRNNPAQHQLVAQAQYTGSDGKWLLTVPGEFLHTRMLPLLFDTGARAPHMVVSQPGTSRSVHKLSFTP